MTFIDNQLTLCKVHFMVYALPDGGVYEKLLSPSRSSSRQVLMRALTGSPRSVASWIVHSRAPPLVKMQNASNMIAARVQVCQSAVGVTTLICVQLEGALAVDDKGASDCE